MKRNQQDMETVLKQRVEDMNHPGTPGMTAMMEAAFVSCDVTKRQLRLAFSALPWEMNLRNQMMGGMLATMFDLGMILLSSYFSGEVPLATVGLDTRFIKPIPLGETLYVDVFLVAAGNTLFTLRGEGILEKNGQVVATADATFIRLPGMKNEWDRKNT